MYLSASIAIQIVEEINGRKKLHVYMQVQTCTCQNSEIFPESEAFVYFSSNYALFT